MTTYTQTLPNQLAPIPRPNWFAEMKKVLLRQRTRKTLSGLTNSQRRDIGLLPISDTPKLNHLYW